MRLGDHVLGLLIGDQYPGLVQLQAAGEVLEPEDALADAGASFDHVHLVRHEAAGAVIEEVDAADDALRPGVARLALVARDFLHGLEGERFVGFGLIAGAGRG